MASFACGYDTPGDKAAIRLSQLIIDDPPPDVIGHSVNDGQEHKSMIIIYRLQQKIEAHSKYVRFLVDVELLDRLSHVTHKSVIVPTSFVLCQHGEILQAAFTLRKLHDRLVT